MIPGVWKVLLHQSGDVSDLSNYCPISKQPFSAKMPESLVSLKLHAFIDLLNVLQPQQSGFHSGHSTITIPVSVIDKNN